MANEGGGIGGRDRPAFIRGTTGQLPELIHTAIRRSGKTQRQFSREMGMEEGHVSRVLRGDRSMTLDFLRAAQRNLNIRVVLLPWREERKVAE